LLAISACLAQQPSFDAASVKAVNLATHPVFGNEGGPGSSDPGRIHLCCVGMYSLLVRAYDVQVDQISGPAWIMDNMGPNLYLIDATMPAGTTLGQYRLMMQNLLVERFHLSIHRETRNFPAYELVVAKDGPKLQASVPAPEGPDMKTSLGHGMVRVQAREKPISELVLAMGALIAHSQGVGLSDFAAPKARVVDRTGLTGTYDFTLEFNCEGCRGLGVPSDSTGSDLPTIFAALEKLGLKLEKAKDVAMDVIVVDRVDKVPTEN
ncbi:MAG TPA: TIGR03435 family protein, partial [Steroidobacteraceae bacterium]|nr:TIGR03435 family protein [Steroidobacteraceae bacterium]